MADTLTAPAAGAVLGFDLVTLPDGTTGVYVSRIKAGFGVDGAYLDVVRDASPLPVDTVVRTSAADRGAIIGFSGAQISTTSASNTITLTTAPTLGTWQLGQLVAAAGIPPGSYLYALVSGVQGAAGSSYTLSSSATSMVAANATAAATGVATTSVGPQQIMASNPSRRGLAYRNLSSTAAIYVNGITGATADYHSLPVYAREYFESSSVHVGTGAITAIADTAATPLYAREF